MQVARVASKAGARKVATGFASLHPPPPSALFLRFAETVEKGPLLAGFCVSSQTDPGLRSRKCGNFDPWSPVQKIPVLARFRLFAVSCAAR
jgi:hypothetical protein